MATPQTHARVSSVARSQRVRVIHRAGGHHDKATRTWRLPDGRTFASMDEAYAAVAQVKRGRQ